MNTYLRMLKMIKPYIAHTAGAVVLMVVFSTTSIFSLGMLLPFLNALFLEETAAVVVVEESPELPLLVQDSAVPVVPEIQSTVVAEDPESLREKIEGVGSLRENLLEWVNGYFLKGTKQENLLRIVVSFFFLILIKNLTGYFQEILMVYVGQSVIRDLRAQLFMRFTSLPLSFFHKNKAGELISRATNDVLIAQQCVGLSFTKLIRDPLFIIMHMAVALLLSWKMTVLALTLMPLSLIVIVRIGKRLRSLSTIQQEQMAKLTSTLQETVYGVRVIKAFAMEDFENKKFLGQNQELFKQVFRINWLMKMSSPLTEQLSSMVGLFLLWYGGTKIFTGGDLPPGLFVVFLVNIFSMVRPLKSLGQVNNEIQAGMAAADRIFDILDTLPEVPDPQAGQSLPKISGRVELSHVDFSYVKNEPVLKDISLKVEPGEVVALVGSSGGGKSTLVDMIPGFYNPDQGQVLVDGLDILDWNLTSLRQNMGIVTQEVILFHDTVLANIAYGMDNVSLGDVKAAAMAANAHVFIEKLPDGYNTIIGDRGLKLSGGQRQRLSIARAILKNPPILLLDEATSALDTESEQLVQEAIDRLVKHRTTIVIAHRLSTIQNVNRIYLLEKGQVVQVGTHEELLASGGRYKELYTMQFN
jgi:ATP-binding cassette, subfamily B, bacterial MsbA